ncbi:hypothetical protein HMPREF9017_01601 [Parascardovia denticolens F0305]|nr:hypothetical protein HMPREF9017_01601 [Parascardovia denticolens F0305]
MLKIRKFTLDLAIPVLRVKSLTPQEIDFYFFQITLRGMQGLKSLRSLKVWDW